MNEVVPAQDNLLDSIPRDRRIRPTKCRTVEQEGFVPIKRAPAFLSCYVIGAELVGNEKAQVVQYRLVHQTQAKLAEHLKTFCGFLPLLKLNWRIVIIRIIVRDALSTDGLKRWGSREVESPDESKPALQGCQNAHCPTLSRLAR